jgi:hypothetical protein
MRSRQLRYLCSLLFDGYHPSLMHELLDNLFPSINSDGGDLFSFLASIDVLDDAIVNRVKRL